MTLPDSLLRLWSRFSAREKAANVPSPDFSVSAGGFIDSPSESAITLMEAEWRMARREAKEQVSLRELNKEVDALAVWEEDSMHCADQSGDGQYMDFQSDGPLWIAMVFACCAFGASIGLWISGGIR